MTVYSQADKPQKWISHRNSTTAARKTAGSVEVSGFACRKRQAATQAHPPPPYARLRLSSETKAEYVKTYYENLH